MESFDRVCWGNTDCADEEFGTVLDGHFDQFVKLSVCVVVVRLSRAAAYLREGEVDAEWEGFVRQIRFEFVDDLLGMVNMLVCAECREM